MRSMNFSRRSFIGGAFSFGALAGCRAFTAPAGMFSGDGANLVLGVVSDIHVIKGPGNFGKCGDTVQFERALRWFDAQGADGVIVAGDMADSGLVEQLECVGEAWFRVFPGGRAADGRKVEQLFVYGNHDFRYHDKKDMADRDIRRDPAAAWKHVFHEEYAPIWFKEVKGYQFVGAHWSLHLGKAGEGIPEVVDWFRDHATEIRRDRPFFFIQHCHPKDTVYGADAWCPDKGYATRALSAFPNAIAFSGHSHASLTDERSIWQGAFTSIGASSLRYGGYADSYSQRQGMLVKVYDDRVVIVRRDFLHEISLGDDWVFPLPVGDGKRPFDFELRKAAGTAPEFPVNAKLSVEPHKNGWLVLIPESNASRTRAFRYEVATGLRDKDGKPIVVLAYDAKYNMPLAIKGKPTRTRCFIKGEKLPLGADGKPLVPKISVTPLDCFGNRGRSLTA